MGLRAKFPVLVLADLALRMPPDEAEPRQLYRRYNHAALPTTSPNSATFYALLDATLAAIIITILAITMVVAVLAFDIVTLHSGANPLCTTVSAKAVQSAKTNRAAPARNCRSH